MIDFITFLITGHSEIDWDWQMNTKYTTREVKTIIYMYMFITSVLHIHTHHVLVAYWSKNLFGGKA